MHLVINTLFSIKQKYTQSHKIFSYTLVCTGSHPRRNIHIIASNLQICKFIGTEHTYLLGLNVDSHKYNLWYYE